MLLKRIAVALALAAALLAVAPAAPASSAAPAVSAAPGVSVTPVASDRAPVQLAWGHFLASEKVGPYHRYEEPESTIFEVVSVFTCTLVPVALATGPAGAVIFGLSCGLVSIA